LGVKVPAPELEITVLSLRALLKYRDRDVLKDMLSIRSPGLPAPILEELRWLLKQTSTEKIAQTLAAIEKAVPADTVLDFLRTVQQTPRAGYKLFNLRRSVRQALRPFQRYSRPRALAGTYQELWGELPFIKSKEDKRMTRREGGLRIAFVGADGAGKSTIIKQTVKWMSWRLRVRTYYMGSNQPSAGTGVLKQLSKIVNRGAAGCRRLMGKRNPITALCESLGRFFESISFLGEGRDRYLRYQDSLMEAKQGAIVLYDRYPLRGIRIFDRFMDGPRTSSTYQGRMGKIARKLAQVEERTYEKISPPDHVMVLRVSPEVSQARKPDHKRDLIEAKSLALDKFQVDGFGVTVIEADQPLDQVMLQVKAAVWQLL
jgi:thymidylate kinase